ncbi:MAG TPA: hypothetical protein VH373_09875 [Jatrophihabitantaceae bacterium]|jgi:hypothetical protein
MQRGPRSFDPVLLGQRECAAWAAYYRHEWGRLLISSVGLVRTGFEMAWPRTLLGAWYVLRANQAWAPYPNNDPDAARGYMRRFYALVVADGGLELNPAEAARREVEWWRVHRMHQREDGLSEADLARTLGELYAHVYDVEPADVAEAAHHRVVAMRLSDEWVEAGCDRADPRLADERRELIASYTALLAAVARPAQPRRSST